MKKALIVTGLLFLAESCLAFTNGQPPKPAVDPTAGTWKYRGTGVQPDGTFLWTYSVTIKESGAVWIVTDSIETPDGPVTDVSTLEKGTLILRKESFKHFAKPGRPCQVTITLDFTDNKVSGTTNRSGQGRPVALDLSGPVFGDAVGQTIGCLPLTVGYSTTFLSFDVQNLRERLLQLTVLGTERVTVPGGTFDSYKVELTSVDGSYKQTIWVAKDSRMPVKATERGEMGGTFTTELVR